jgi:hypothetical protein
MPYRIETREIAELDLPIVLNADQDGWALILRKEGQLCGFLMQPAALGSTIAGDAVSKRVVNGLGLQLQAQAIEAEVRARAAQVTRMPAPRLSVAICTKDRAQRLSRLLDSLLPLCDGSPFAAVEIQAVRWQRCRRRPKLLYALHRTHTAGLRTALRPRPGQREGLRMAQDLNSPLVSAGASDLRPRMTCPARVKPGCLFSSHFVSPAIVGVLRCRSKGRPDHV